MVFSSRVFIQTCVFFAFFWLATITSASTTILPSTQALSLVIKEITKETLQPLVPANASPHDFSLKPSHIRRIQKAQLVVWLGPELEPYLAKVMSRIPHHKQFIINQKGLPLAYGLHPWTNPEYLMNGMLELSQHMGTPWDSQAWRQQMTLLKTQIQSHQKRLLKNQQGYLVYHDGIDGFESYFGLEHLASFTNSDDQPPGAKGMAAIAQLAKEQQVACVLTDHETKPKLIDAVIGPEVERIQIDILATHSTSLVSYINRLGQAVLDCGHSIKQ
ncbi:MAG: zinc ABC transporter substrate-binding protein [Oceanospirillaceae bacterium]|nr:zinc ABC transporter substrate-binding protein [Oceanospirillaceae bacterium]